METPISGGLWECLPAQRDVHGVMIWQIGHTQMPVIRVHTEETCPFLPPEVSRGPDPAKGQCHLVPLTRIVKESIPAAPDKKCRQSLPRQQGSHKRGPRAVVPRADTAAHLCARPSSATGLATGQPNCHHSTALPGTAWSGTAAPCGPHRPVGLRLEVSRQSG